MEFQQVEMDRLLRRSLSASVPALPPDFDRRMLRTVSAAHTHSQWLGLYRAVLFTAYGFVSAATSVVAMRGVGMHWLPMSEILAPLALIAAGYSTWQAWPAIWNAENLH